MKDKEEVVMLEDIVNYYIPSSDIEHNFFPHISQQILPLFFSRLFRTTANLIASEKSLIKIFSFQNLMIGIW